MKTARERMLEGVGLSERRLTLAGTSTTILEGGEGPPLVLLHGGIECGGAVWTPVVPLLAGDHSLVIPDLPGLGDSEPVERLDARTFGAWFRELLDETCSEEALLVAHSLGGTLAMRFAASDGERLRRLIVYASPGVGRYRMPLGLRLVAIRFAIRPTERNADRFDRWAFADFDSARAQMPDWFGAFSEYCRAQARAPDVKRTMRGLITNCTKQVPDSELTRITAPTALITGSKDRFVPLGLTEAASVRLDWPLATLQDAGHAAHVERPAEFASALDALAGAKRPPARGGRGAPLQTPPAAQPTAPRTASPSGAPAQERAAPRTDPTRR